MKKYTGKYAPLGPFLEAQGEAVTMTFKDIEARLGFRLPPSAYTHRAWWSNNVSNSAMTKIWMAAKFLTEDVDMQKQELVFRRSGSMSSALPPNTPRADVGRDEPATKAKPSGFSEKSVLARFRSPFPEKQQEAVGPVVTHHPLIGALKGTIRIVAGTDLSKPADPSWGKRDA